MTAVTLTATFETGGGWRMADIHQLRPEPEPYLTRREAASRLPHGQALARAGEDTEKARARLERIYGRVPAVVFFYQRDPDGPLGVSHSSNLVRRVMKLYAGDPRPVLIRAVVPGGRALMEWFKGNGGASVTLARACGDQHATWFMCGQSMRAATVSMLRWADGFLADFERLACNGASLREIADAAGIKPARAWKVSVSMRALGFELPELRMPPRR